MNKETYTVIITAENVKEDKTNSGRLIDKVSMALDQWTEDDLIENNIDWEGERLEYIKDNHDYDESALELINGKAGKEATVKYMDETEDTIKKVMAGYKKGKVKLGAFIALEYPELWTRIIENYKEAISEVWYNSDELEAINKDLAKERQEAVNGFWQDLEHARMWGDRDYAGIVRLFQKELDAEDVDYKEKADKFIITFTRLQAEDYINNGDELENITAQDLKDRVIEWIGRKMVYKHDKEMEERRRRQEENKNTREYQERCQKEMTEQKRAKLLAMKK